MAEPWGQLPHKIRVVGAFSPQKLIRSVILGHKCRVRVVIARLAFASYPIPPVPFLCTTILVDRFRQSRDEEKAADSVDPGFCQTKI